MILRTLLEQRHSFPHPCVQHNGMRLSLMDASLLKSSKDGGDIVAVDPLSVPAKSRPLVHDRLDIHYLLRGAVGLLIVVIDEGHEIVQAVMGSSQGRFPGGPFLEFSIGKQTKDPRGPLFQTY